MNEARRAGVTGGVVTLGPHGGLTRSAAAGRWCATPPLRTHGL